MRRRIPKRLRQKYYANKKKRKPKKKSFLKELLDELRAGSIKAIVFAVGSILLFLAVYILGYTDAGARLYEANEKQEEFTTTKHYSIEGVLVDCDSLPIPGVKVVARGFDVDPALTDNDGFFSAIVKLPIELDEIQIRFLNSRNQEIYTTLYALDKNPVEDDELLIYVIPDRFQYE